MHVAIIKIVTTTFVNVSILLIGKFSVKNKQQIIVNIYCAFVGQI